MGMNEEDLIGKTIKTIDVDGFSVEITFTDGTGFVYVASDGGYSQFDFYDGQEAEEKNEFAKEQGDGKD